MSTIATINNGDSGLSVRTDINTNFSNLNADKLETSVYTAADVKSKYESNADTNAFTDAEKAAIVTNTAKVGITPTQASNITTNNAKVSYTDSAAVALNTAKTSDINHVTLELPNVDNTSDATKNSATATLTNKTITSPIINVTSDAEGDLYYRNSGGLFTRLPIGTAGQVLTESSGVPSWADASGGGASSINLQYPHDLSSGFDTVYYDMGTSDTYTVTTGKTLYITHASSSVSTAILKVGGTSVIQPNYNASDDQNIKLINPIIVAAGEDVTATGSTVYWAGFEVDENSNITEVYNNAGYTVPTSKVLIINNWHKTGTGTITMNNGSGAESMLYGKIGNADSDVSMAVLGTPILMNAGDVIAADTTNSFTGVLIPDTFIV